jgi:phage baseplate assembly protein W
MSSDAATLMDITSADWSLELGSIGGVVQGIRDIDQCLAIILTTPRGSDPLRPTFGADLWRYIDNPISVAIPSIVREVSAAIAMWEPRVAIQSVTVSPASDSGSQSGAHLNVFVTWQLKLAGSSSSSRVTVVGLAGGAR